CNYYVGGYNFAQMAEKVYIPLSSIGQKFRAVNITLTVLGMFTDGNNASGASINIILSPQSLTESIACKAINKYHRISTVKVVNMLSNGVQYIALEITPVEWTTGQVYISGIMELTPIIIRSESVSNIEYVAEIPGL
ncbi:MAG: hypothetical protein ACRCX5_12300, partial [Bacteroidales bacterium]